MFMILSHLSNSSNKANDLFNHMIVFGIQLLDVFIYKKKII